jgi:hypothetical protein
MTRGTTLAIGLCLAGMVAAFPLFAQRAKSPSLLDQKSRLHGPFHAADSGVAPEQASAVADVSGWRKFTADHGPQTIYIDPNSGRPSGVSGTGIPWIPGRGNVLTPELLYNRGLLADAGAKVDITVLERLARQFLADNASLVRIPAGMELRLSPPASIQISDSMWSVWFNLYYDGVAIPGGSVNFVVKHGNLILWGTHNLDDVHIPARAAVSDVSALELAGEYAGGFDPATDTLGEAPTLALLHESSGAGHGYRRVWEVRFSRENEGNYLARVDAQNGEVIEFFDETDYAQVKGGIYPISNLPTGSEVTRPLGFANYGTSLYSDAGGNFPYTSGTVTSTLAGKYVTINDNCGAVSLSASAAPGDLNFSTNTGTNCTTPGVGGAGNTNSARSCYFHTDLIKQKGRIYLPSNAWLQAKLPANVNINNVCNAFWTSTGGGSVNFYRDGTSGTTHCGNTGEIAGVFLHEWGHGMDSNDGNGAQGSGEAMGDTVAMLQLRNSCIGNGFWLSTRGCGGGAASGYNCSGYGACCSSCSGVRDQDYLKLAGNQILTPANITARCTSTGGDPCGREVHCESFLAGNTVWDMASRDLPARADLAPEDAWNLADKLWWESGPTRTAGYTCTNKTGAPWNNGCGSTTWYKTFLAADDDNGNLADGTPHATTLFTSFNRHGISCGIATDAANKDFTTCPTIGSSGTLSGAAGPNQAVLNWTTSATNGASVDVKRNNLGCAFSFTKIASVSPIATRTYTDTGASGGTTWYYIVQPIGSNVDCLGPASNCVSVTPTVSTCSAPTGVNAPTVADAGTSCTATGITVTWAAPTAWGDTSGTRTWTVLRNGVAVASGPCTGAIAGTTLTCTDTTAVAGTAYTYTVRANNGCGSSTTSAASASVTDLTGAVPSGLANNTAADANACTATGNAVNWAAPTAWNDNASGTRTWTVLRNGTAIASGLAVGTLTYTDATAVVGTAYTYTVRAVNGCALNTTTAGASATDLTGTAPSGLANNTAADANACTATGNAVNWAAPTAWNDNASGTRTWTVLRNGTAIASGLAVGTVTYADATAAVGTAYSYTVRAVNGCALNTTTAGASATDLADTVAPSWASPNPQLIAKTAPNLIFTWPSAEAGATYLSYSATTPNPASWTSRNTTGTLGWTDAADLGTATSLFFTTTARDACLNESPK